MTEENRQVNIQEIIPLVEKKPVLWDHGLELFKHKNETLAAWDEICSGYNKAYDNLTEAEKNNYRGIVIRKWRNVKDSWRKNLVKTIRGEKGHKNYVYDKELLFLKQGMKMKPKRQKRKSPSTTDPLTGDELSRQSEFQIKSESLNTDFDENDSNDEELITNELTNESDYYNKTDTESNIDDKLELNDFGKKSVGSINNAKPGLRMPSFSYSQGTISNPAESEISPLTNSREQEDRHVSFIKGVLPSLRNFNERQVLKFQMGVLQLIQNIQEDT